MKLMNVAQLVVGLSLSAALVACTSASGGGEGEGGGGEGDACAEEGAFQPCYLENDADGSPSGGQECVPDDAGDLAWNACQEAGTASSTPLVLSFDLAPVSFSRASGHFDLSAVASFMTDWPAASTPWLAIDRSGDGRIDSGEELFGSASLLSSGERAPNGFVALAELDTDGDGVLSPADAGWSKLLVWADADQDRASSSSELRTLDAHGIESIELGYAIDRRCDTRGNCEVERASFRYRAADGSRREGAIVDVHLRHR